MHNSCLNSYCKFIQLVFGSNVVITGRWSRHGVWKKGKNKTSVKGRISNRKENEKLRKSRVRSFPVNDNLPWLILVSLATDTHVITTRIWHTRKSCTQSNVFRFVFKLINCYRLYVEKCTRNTLTFIYVYRLYREGKLYTKKRSKFGLCDWNFMHRQIKMKFSTF